MSDNSAPLRVLLSLIAGIIGGIIGIVLVAVVGVVLIVANSDRLGGVLGRIEEAVGNVTMGLAAGESVVHVVEDVNPAVVSIVITKDVPVIERYYQQIGPFRVPAYQQSGTETREVGGGSGFLVSGDGDIVTNAHVVNVPNAEYTVFLNDGTTYKATVVATDEFLDIALIDIEAEGLPYLSFGDSDDLRVGQTVIAIGNALGEFRNTVSVGVVSGLARTITASDARGRTEELENVIQTDAAINSGNSGGPLLDLTGRVIGVNVAASQGAAENIGFALPANEVRRAVEEMRNQ